MLLWTMYRGDENVWFVSVWALVLNPLPSQFLPSEVLAGLGSVPLRRRLVPRRTPEYDRMLVA